MGIHCIIIMLTECFMPTTALLAARSYEAVAAAAAPAYNYTEQTLS